jgi:hypothetical protein
VEVNDASFKGEEVDLSAYEDFGDALRGLGRLPDDVYDRKRIHSSSGYLTPAEFESQWREGRSASARAHVPDAPPFLCPNSGAHFNRSAPVFRSWIQQNEVCPTSGRAAGTAVKRPVGSTRKLVR